MKMSLILYVTIFYVVTITNAEVSHLVAGNAKFAASFFKTASDTTNENLLISPFSAHMCLSLVHQGAAGLTDEAFNKVLGVPNQRTSATEYKELMTELTTTKKVTLNIANKVFLNQEFKLHPTFKFIATDQYLADAEEINFSKKQKAADTINSWVESKTNNKIKNIVKKDDFSAATKLVLVNALYFNGAWAKKFDKKYTEQGSFFLPKNKEVKVDMMHQRKKFRFLEDEEMKAKMIEMYYADYDMSMLVILPNDVEGLNAVENKVLEKDLAHISDHMIEWEVDLYMPKFKIESTLEMKEILIKMGLEEIFSTRANFTKLAENGEKVKVDGVIQKTYLDVNEEGTEAAAATVIGAVGLALPVPVQKTTLKVDHPFLVAILKKHWQGQGSSVLFLGRVVNPTNSV